LRCRWKQLRATVLSETHFNSLIDSVFNLVNEARQRHFQRWPILGQYVWPNAQPIPATYEGEIAALKTWIASRLQWIDGNIPNSGACMDYHYPANVNESVVISIQPNPFPGNAGISIESRVAQTITLNIFDAGGRNMHRNNYNLSAGYNSINIPFSQWSAGVYFFSFKTSAGEKIIRKAIKQ
jgi:hypothetical protein